MSAKFPRGGSRTFFSSKSNSIRSSICLFDDATTIYIVIDNTQIAAFISNADLEKING